MFKLECRHPHHPAEIEYFQWKSKKTCDASTQTEPEPEPKPAPPPYEMPIIPPPPQFSEPSEAEQKRLFARKYRALRLIENGEMKISDFDVQWFQKKRRTRKTRKLKIVS